MIRFSAFSLALAAAALSPLGAAPQPTAAEATEASRGAEDVAARAKTAMERVDPTTLGPSQVLNPSLSNPYAAPPLAPAAVSLPAENPLDDEVTYASAPRGPAVRMIAREVVQPLPAAPAPATAQIAQAAPPRAARSAQRKREPFVVKSILPIEGSIRYGDWFWDESAAPATGTLVITIDLEARVISAFRDGHEIGTAVALLGTPSHPTPTGTFPVLNKSREHFSRKYNNAPMPHSLWLTNTGIAIHGSPVTNGYASHGCVGVPDPFAEKLFAATKRGDKVIITRGRMIGVGDKVI
jgi:lipoprotein-anchoring transpeptidase ErfK/SrfK